MNSFYFRDARLKTDRLLLNILSNNNLHRNFYYLKTGVSKMFINPCTFPSVTLWLYLLFGPWPGRSLKRKRRSRRKILWKFKRKRRKRTQTDIKEEEENEKTIKKRKKLLFFMSKRPPNHDNCFLSDDFVYTNYSSTQLRPSEASGNYISKSFNNK